MNQFSTVTEQLSDGAHVVSVEGEIDMVTAPQFEAELLRAVEAARHPVVVDLTECDFLDSTALAVLIEASKRLDGGGPLALVIPRPHARTSLPS